MCTCCDWGEIKNENNPPPLPLSALPLATVIAAFTRFYFVPTPGGPGRDPGPGLDPDPDPDPAVRPIGTDRYRGALNASRPKPLSTRLNLWIEGQWTSHGGVTAHCPRKDATFWLVWFQQTQVEPLDLIGLFLYTWSWERKRDCRTACCCFVLSRPNLHPRGEKKCLVCVQILNI